MSARCRRFVDKVALVTGAGGGIGFATAERFAAEGARVVLVDLDEQSVEEKAERLRTAGAHVMAVVTDLASNDGAAEATRRAEETFGRVDTFALIAGISGPRTPVHELALADWDRVIATNLRSMFLSLQAGARSMIRNGVAGSLVTMSSSMAQWDVLDGGSAYAASKGGVLALTRAAAFDLATYGIRVNAVCPGVIDTALGVPTSTGGVVTPTSEQFAHRIPLRRIGQPDDVAATVAYLASDDAAHVTGVGWLIDGGQTLQSWANSPTQG